MDIIDLAQFAGLTPAFLALFCTAALGLALHASFPPPHESLEEAVLAAGFVL